MSKQIKKVLSLLLAVTLLFGAAPLNGFVGLELPKLSALFAPVVHAADPTSGTCGANLTWSYDLSTATLTISGSGKMNDYDYGNAPWGSYSQLIKNVVIRAGATSIGARAFSNYTGLTSVTIPNSVTSIGDDAFWGCTRLTSVTIGNSVTSIGACAFENCTGLTSVTIPASVTSIGTFAFSFCTGLTAITVDANNPNYYSDNYGVLYNKNKTVLIQYPVGNTRTTFTIPNSVTEIESYAFSDCTGLTSLTIPNSVTNIGSEVFGNCTGLTAITVDANNPYYSSDSFGALYNKNKTQLLRYPIGNTRTSFTIPNSVTSVGGRAFYGCTGLTSVTIPNSVTSIGWGAFFDCNGLTSMTIPNSVTSIGWYAFNGCTGLTSVTISNSVTSIGDSAFHGCTGLTSVTIPNSITSIGNFAFYGCTGLTSVTIPNSITSIGYSAFHGCTGLTSVTIPDSVTSIDEGAFSSCTGLTSVTIPNSVTSISRNAFDSVPNIVYSGSASGSPWGARSINGYVEAPLVYADSKKARLLACSSAYSGGIIIPNSVTYINSDSFENCTKLTSVTIPNGVTSIPGFAFSDCTGLTAITVDASHPSFSSDSYGVLYNKDRTKLIRYPIGKNSSSFTIPNSVTSIDTYAFYNCTGLTSMTISNSVTSIDSCAFYNCTGLTSVTIPNSVERIGSQAFENCTELKNVIIPNSITSIGYRAFYDTAYYKTSNNWQNGVLYIGNHLIEAKTDFIGSYEIRSGTKCISEHAFSRCTGLTSVTIPNSVTSIGDSAFRDCTGLTSVTIGNSVTSIGSYAFCNCTGLTSVTIGNSVTRIGERAFYGCTGLTSVTIPDSVTSIGSYAFSYCTGLTSVTIPNSVTSIGGSAFRGCTGITDVYYTGSEAQWKKITISAGNDPLTNATIHYNSSGGDNPPGSFGEYGVILEKERYKTTLGETFEVKVKSLYLPEHETGDLIWESSDPSVSVVSHDKYATVTAEKPGYAVITVTSHGGGYSDHCFVFVGDQSLVIGKQNGILEVGKEQEYMVSLCNADYVNMSANKTVSIDHAYASAEEISEITFVIADQSIATITSTKIEKGIIEIKVKGVREGITYVTVTFNTTGEVRYFPIYVTNTENTYYVNSIPSKKYNNGQTYNICQSGIYIYNFKAEDGDGTYSNISFDAYNTTGIIGSVDIYNENGDLVRNVMIKSFDFQPTDPIKGMKTLYYLIPAICTLSYNDITKPFNSSKTSVSFKLPTNGYFKINNDISASFPCLLYNAVNLTIESISKFAGLKSTLSSDSKDQADKEVAEMLLEYILEAKAFGSESGAVLKTLSKLKDEMLKDAERFDVKNFFSIMDELCTHLRLNIDYVELAKSTLVNILKSAANDVLLIFDKTKVAKYLYKYQSWENYCTTLSDLDLHNGDGSSFIYNIQGGTRRISNGVIFEGSADDVAVFRTYEVSYGEMVDELSKEYSKSKLYDISLVKNNQLTQPNATAKVLIPIPLGYSNTALKVYRINDDGSKEDMKAHVEGNYLVFETNHFSYYAIVDETNRIPGDADDSGTVTLRDAAMISRYLAGGWDVTINTDNADVDGSGTVTLRDAAMISRYLAGGWDVELI